MKMRKCFLWAEPHRLTRFSPTTRLTNILPAPQHTYSVLRTYICMYSAVFKEIFRVLCANSDLTIVSYGYLPDICNTPNTEIFHLTSELAQSPAFPANQRGI